MKTQTRILQLDGLRFIAVFMIFVAHWAQNHFHSALLKEIPFVHGVTLFFVLSGYLITLSLLKNKGQLIAKGKILKVFYLRRFLRIFPIYYLLLFILFILNYEQTRPLIAWLATYTTNIYQSIENVEIGHLNHLWSLAVEEQFYIFWPFIILFVKPKFTTFSIIATIVFSILVKAYLFFYIGKWMATAYFTLSCMYALGLGALLAKIQLDHKIMSKFLRQKKWFYFALVIYGLIILFGINSKLPWFKEIFDEFIFAIIAMMGIHIASNNGFTNIGKWMLELPFVIHLGQISYGLYLYHLLVPSLFLFLSNQLGITVDFKPILFIIYFVITFLLAQLSWVLIEKPLLKMKKKIPY